MNNQITYAKSTGCTRKRERRRGEREKESFACQLHIHCYLLFIIYGRSKCAHTYETKMTVKLISTSLPDEFMHSGKYIFPYLLLKVRISWK